MSRILLRRFDMHPKNLRLNWKLLPIFYEAEKLKRYAKYFFAKQDNTDWKGFFKISQFLL